MLEEDPSPAAGAGGRATRPGRVLVGKPHSSTAIRSHLRTPHQSHHLRVRRPGPNRLSRGSKGGRPSTFDRELYKQCNTVERAINKLRQHRAVVATRYDKRDFVWRGFVDVATIRIWLRGPVT